ncbi:MAG: hypothetical protein WC358_00005, partial [Ignavibacteria bacterium]
GLIYHFDFGTGTRLSKKQAVSQKRMNRIKGHPDFILYYKNNSNWSGLVLEIKRYGERIFKKDGKTYASEHIKEQAEYLDKLFKQGFKTYFAIGYKDCIEKIVEYVWSGVLTK